MTYTSDTFPLFSVIIPMKHKRSRGEENGICFVLMPSDCAFADPVDEDPAGELRSCCLSGFTRLLRQIASGPGVEAEGARWCNAAAIRASALCSGD